MGFFSKNVSNTFDSGIRLANRFIKQSGGFQEINGTAGTVRTDSVDAIKSSIKAWSKVDKDIADFARDMETMDSKYLGLAHDIIDLAHEADGKFGFAAVETNLLEQTNKGKSWLGVILDVLPKTSKENPAALDLVQEVIDNTGVEQAKYVVQAILGKYDMAASKGIIEQLKAVKPFVKDYVAGTGGPILEYADPYFEKRHNFLMGLMKLFSSDTKPENIALIKKAAEVSDMFKTEGMINTDVMRVADTARLKENLEVLPVLLENADKQSIKSVDVSSFLANNVNMK